MTDKMSKEDAKKSLIGGLTQMIFQIVLWLFTRCLN